MHAKADQSKEVINVHAAKTHFSKLLARVEKGEEIIIARGGKPVARLVPAEPPKRKAVKAGFMKGAILYMADDFDAPMPEFEDAFYNGPLMTSEEDVKKFREQEKQRQEQSK